MTKKILEKNVYNIRATLTFWFGPSPTKEASFMTYTAASHQGPIETLRLHFWGAVMWSIFIYSLWALGNKDQSIFYY